MPEAVAHFFGGNKASHFVMISSTMQLGDRSMFESQLIHLKFFFKIKIHSIQSQVEYVNTLEAQRASIFHEFTELTYLRKKGIVSRTMKSKQ